MRELTSEEKSDLKYALQMWCNYIETSSVTLSASDIERGASGKVNKLAEFQVRAIEAKRRLITLIEQDNLVVLERGEIIPSIEPYYRGPDL